MRAIRLAGIVLLGVVSGTLIATSWTPDQLVGAALGALVAALVLAPAQVLVLALMSRAVGLRLVRLSLGSGPVLVDRVGPVWTTVRALPLSYLFRGAVTNPTRGLATWTRVAWLALLPLLPASLVLVAPVPATARYGFAACFLAACVWDFRGRWRRRALAASSAETTISEESSAVVNRALSAPISDPDTELVEWIRAHPDDVAALQAASLRFHQRGDTVAAERVDAAWERTGVGIWLLQNVRLVDLAEAAERGEAQQGWATRAEELEAQLVHRDLDPAVLETLALSRVLRGDPAGAEGAIDGCLRHENAAGTDNAGRAQIQATLALVHAAHGRAGAARAALARARRLDPGCSRLAATQRRVDQWLTEGYRSVEGSVPPA
jgi:hypothetical protein